MPSKLVLRSLTFANAEDYDKIAQDGVITISNIFDGMENNSMTARIEATGETVELVCSFTERQKAILKAGGLLNYTREG